jgi:hypothetical protein
VALEGGAETSSPWSAMIDGIINAATVAENKPHYNFRVNGVLAQGTYIVTYKDEDRIYFSFQKFIFSTVAFL